MKIVSAVFVYNRPRVLGHCLRTIFANTVQPDELLLIDDGSQHGAASLAEEYSWRDDRCTLICKGRNRGATHSWNIALEWAIRENAQYFFPIEADYIFRPDAFATVLDVFEQTEHGQQALGIIGYDHPNATVETTRNKVFPEGMKRQVGEDNVNRGALYRDFQSGRHTLQLASNTCPTCYLKLGAIFTVAREFPELIDLLYQVGNPRHNPNYPDSGVYAQKHYIDDGMLSHAISLVWNRWAIKHGIDRNKFGAWLNIKPSVADNITGGGEHTDLPEGQSDGRSLSWK